MNKKILRKTTAWSLGALLFLTLPLSASATTILSESFAAGQRLTQDLPNTAAWYGTSGSTGTAPTMSDPGGIVTVDMSANAQILAYFTDTHGSPVSLAVGETLNISFGFQMAGAANQGIGVRTGVFDSSNGGRISGDASGTSILAFRDYTGYGGWFNPLGSATSVRERTNSDASNALLSGSGTGIWTSRATSSSAVAILNGTDYTGSYSIERTLGGVIVTFGLSGPNFTDFTVSYNDVGSSLTSFDTLAIWLNGGAGDSFSLTGVEIAVIPEPSTYALALGLVAAAFLMIRRRRSAASRP